MELIFKSVENMKEQRKAIGEWVSMTGTRTVDIRLNFNMTNHRSSGWSRVTSTPAKGSLKISSRFLLHISVKQVGCWRFAY